MHQFRTFPSPLRLLRGVHPGHGRRRLRRLQRHPAPAPAPPPAGGGLGRHLGVGEQNPGGCRENC